MREHGMFGFLLSEAPNKNADLQILSEYAKHAARAYVSRDQIPLNHSIQKLAKTENLTPDQISIVCQEANKEVHGQLFKTAEDKYVTFELADPSCITNNIEASVTKTASAQTLDDEYAGAPYEQVSQDFSFSKSAGHDGFKFSQEHQKRSDIMTKQASMAEIEKDVLILSAQIESAENRFVKIARNCLNDYPLNERSKYFPMIAKFCELSGMSKVAYTKLIDYTALVMKKQGLLEKNADIKADPDLISDNLDARIQNGTHPLYIEIKTIMDKNQQRETYKNRYNRIQTELDDYRADGAILGQRVKEL